MKNKKFMLPIVILILATVILAVVHLKNAPQVQEGTLLVIQGSEQKYVALSTENAVPVTGTLVNGKGDKTDVNATGLPLADILELADIVDFTTVTVTARDEYSAEITSEEILTENMVYLIFEDEGTFRLVVFGDPNSKRNVSDVIKLTVQ